MESPRGFSFNSAGAVMKKRRSNTLRRPRPDSQLVFRSQSHDVSPPSTTPSSDNAGNLSPSGSAANDPSNRRKEFCLNDPAPRKSSVSKMERIPASKKIKKDNKTSHGFDGFPGNDGSRGGLSSNNEHGRRGPDLKRCSEGALSPANCKSTSRIRESFEKSRSPDGNVGKIRDGHNTHQAIGDVNMSAENKLRKVKLKVGGVTRTIHAKSNEETGNGGNSGSSSAKLSRSLDASRHHQKAIYQDNSGSSLEKGNGSQGDRRKDFSGMGFSQEAKGDSRGGKATEERLSGKQMDKAHTIPSSEPVRKSNRVPKRRVLDGAFGEEDDEIRYLEKLRTSKGSTYYNVEQDNDGEDVKKRKLSKVSNSKNTPYEVDEEYGFSQPSKDSGKKRPGKESDDTDYFEEEEPDSDADPESKRKKLKKVSVDSSIDVRTEPLTTRQRALQSGKGGPGASLIEFPDGLPPPPPRKQKEKLSEEEQQAKKAEAAQRRKLQVEKQAKAIQEEAIRKILGLDSDRKKEEKKQKEREEKAKAAKSQEYASTTIRWIMGPTGTVVVFPEDIDLQNLFNSKPLSYPPAREKCAGPSCTNVYKYRDSRSNLPLCSLQCYKAVQGNAHSMTTC